MIGIQLGELIFLGKIKIRTQNTFQFGRMARPPCTDWNALVPYGMQMFLIPLRNPPQLPGEQVLLFGKEATVSFFYFLAALAVHFHFGMISSSALCASVQQPLTACRCVSHHTRFSEHIKKKKKKVSLYKRLKML